MDGLYDSMSDDERALVLEAANYCQGEAGSGSGRENHTARFRTTSTMAAPITDGGKLDKIGPAVPSGA